LVNPRGPSSLRPSKTVKKRSREKRSGEGTGLEEPLEYGVNETETGERHGDDQTHEHISDDAYEIREGIQNLGHVEGKNGQLPVVSDHQISETEKEALQGASEGPGRTHSHEEGDQRDPDQIAPDHSGHRKGREEGR